MCSNSTHLKKKKLIYIVKQIGESINYQIQAVYKNDIKRIDLFDDLQYDIEDYLGEPEEWYMIPFIKFEERCKEASIIFGVKIIIDQDLEMTWKAFMAEHQIYCKELAEMKQKGVIKETTLERMEREYDEYISSFGEEAQYGEEW